MKDVFHGEASVHFNSVRVKGLYCWTAECRTHFPLTTHKIWFDQIMIKIQNYILKKNLKIPKFSFLFFKLHNHSDTLNRKKTTEKHSASFFFVCGSVVNNVNQTNVEKVFICLYHVTSNFKAKNLCNILNLKFKLDIVLMFNMVSWSFNVK